MKTKMKTRTFILTLPIFLLSLLNCGSAQNNNIMKELVQNPPFKISDAYYQNWVAGVQEGGSGTNVYIVFSELDKDVVIQNIYYKNQILEAKGNVNNRNEFVGYLNNDMKSDVVMDSDPLKEAQNIPSKFPFDLNENEAVVAYWYGGKRNYYKISDLSEKKMIPYPQGNPNQHE